MNRNIPLVQDNSVNSINTSLCAINRAIGQNGVPEVNVNVNYNVTDEVSADNIYPVTSRGVKAALDDLDENVNELIDDLSETVTEHSTITTSSDNTPYSQRVNANKDKSVINKLIGASFAVNQLVKNGNFANTSNWSSQVGTLTISNNVARVTYVAGSQYNQDLMQGMPNIVLGHKYYCSIEHRESSPNVDNFVLNELHSNTTYFEFPKSESWAHVEKVFTPSSAVANYNKRIAPRQSVANYGGSWFEVRNFYIIDLTQMFGSAIADRIYAMEQATEGSGIAWIKSFGFFNNDYYSTDEGSIQNAKPSAHKVNASVVKWFTNRNISSQYAVSIYAEAVLKPNTNYTLYFRGANGASVYSNENLFTTIGTATLNGSLQSIALKTKTKLPYITNSTRFNNGWIILKNAQGNTVVPNFTEFYIVEEGVDADPSFSQNTPLANTELRGIPKLDANNNLYFDGDVYYPNGDVVRKYAPVALSTLTKSYYLNRESAGGLGWVDFTLSSIKSDTLNMLLSQPALPCKSNSAGWQSTTPCMSAIINDKNVAIFRIYETSGMSQADFDAKYNSATLIYELATPTKETVAGYSNPHTLIRKGAEEFVDDRTIALPVGHETEYAKLPSWLSNNVIFL